MTAKKKTETKDIKADTLQLETLNLTLVGTSDLLQNKMSDATKQLLIDKMEGKATQRVNRNFEEEAKEKLYDVTIKGKKYIAVPSFALKSGIVAVTPNMKDLTKVLVRGAIVIESPSGDELIPITYKKMTLDRRFGRPNFRSPPMLIVRPRFEGWECQIRVIYNKAMITPESVINLFRNSGFHNGLGAFSPRSNGNFGRFDVKVSK